MIGSAGGPEKCATIKEKFGYDHAIDYKTCKDADELKAKLKECAPDGIDMYFENVGGMHWDAAFGSLKPKGRIAVCGVISQYNDSSFAASSLPLWALIYPQIKIEGFVCFEWLAGKKGHFLRDMVRYWKKGQLQTTETIMDGLDKWPEAFQSLFTGANNGKVVVTLGEVLPLRAPREKKEEEKKEEEAK